MLLTESRGSARLTPSGDWVRLPDRDRTLWNRDLIDEGQTLVRACVRRDAPGPYQLQAAIAAVHSSAATASDTDWAKIVSQYDQLLTLTPTPIVALNRAIAVAEVDGPQVALTLVDDLELDSYYLWHATRGDLLQRLGEADEVRAALERAAELTDNPAEQALLAERVSAQLAAVPLAASRWAGSA